MLGKVKEEAPAPAAAPAAQPAAEAAPDGRLRCDQCGVLSPKDYRFCVGCGAVLPRKRDIAPAALANAMLKSRRASVKPPKPAALVEARPAEPAKPPEPAKLDAPAKPQPKAIAQVKLEAKPIAPTEDARAPSAAIHCDRCGGRCDAGEVFCKYCGAPLARRPSTGQPSPAVVAAREAMPETRREDDAREQVQHARPALELEVVRQAPRVVAAQESAAPAPAIEEEVTGQLVVIVEDGSEGSAIELRGRQMDVGSVEGDIVLAEDRYLSPRHARLFRQDNQWYLRDLDSLNGVYRRLRKPTTLRNGDLVLLGLEVLQFQMVDHAERGLGHAIQHGVLLFGSPATQRRARLCQRTVEGVTRDVYHLVGDETTIGREIGDIVFTSDPFMSRRHATLKWHEPTQEYQLSDLSSSNGTYLAIREDVRLENGDFIRLGQHLFRVDLLAATAGGGAGARAAGGRGGW
jgi:pSer/pThr/pTyr-binding forkhead associated (FHA) protein